MFRERIFREPATLILAIITFSLAACSAGNESTSNSTDVASPSSSQVADSSAIAIPGVKNLEEITFKPAPKNSINGSFDGTTTSSETTIKVPKTTPVTLRGWAILADAGRPADFVIITRADNNSLVAVSPVNLEREDVVNNLKNPAYKNSGWNATFNPSTLGADKVVLKAWAYNSQTKEAIQLNRTHELHMAS